MRRLVVGGLVLCALSQLAVADPAGAAKPYDPPLGWSVGAGVATAMVPLAVGGGLLATTQDSTVKHAGIEVIAAGLALAPVVSHLIAHEWKRAAIFGVVPLVFGALAVGLLEGYRKDDLLDDGTPTPRVAFGAALAVELFASGAGLVDSLMARERARTRSQTRGLRIVPTFGKNQIGLSLGGSM
jgi:hypothetical protein